MSGFIIFSQQRSGSTWLADLLNSHPEIQCWQELFIRRRPTTEATEVLPPRFHPINYRIEHLDEYMEYIRGRTGPRKLLGFKLLINQEQGLLSRIGRSNAYKIVYLTRENELAAFASHLRAKATGQGIAREGDALLHADITFDPAAFERFRRRREKQRQHAETLLEDLSPDVVRYEYSALSLPETRDEILGFLGVGISTLNTSTQKRGSSHIADRFVNRDDVEAYLQLSGKLYWAQE